MAGWSVPGVVHLREMGVGPAGRRVLARHRLTRKSLAITYLSPEFLADTEFCARIRDECTRLARVREARIARVHRYIGCEHYRAAIISDHISGTSLRALLLAHGAVGTAAALVVLKDALLALAASHRAGLAHGALKPENVMLTPAGRIRLVDFGLWTSESRRLLAQSTPFYLAPEQWGSSGLRQAGDIYAATITFFECLAGAPPFYADEPAELSAKHLLNVPPVEAVPEPVREMVLRGLAKDPGSRPEAQHLLDLIGDVATRALGPGWERQGRQELVSLIANRSALAELPVNRQRPAFGWTFGGPVRLAAVMGGALALAAGLSSPPLPVIPGITIFGSGAMPPVLAFPDPDQGGVAVRRTTNGPPAERAPAVAAKMETGIPELPAPLVPVPSTHITTYDHAAHQGFGPGTAHPYGAGSPQLGSHQPGLGQSLPVFAVCTAIDGHQPCTATNPAQPGTTGSPPHPSPAVPVSVPVQLPIPVGFSEPVRVPVPSAPVLQPVKVPDSVKVPQSIVIRDKSKAGRDMHPKDLLAQLDSQRQPHSAQGHSARADRPSFTGKSGDHPTSRSSWGSGHFTGARNAGDR